MGREENVRGSREKKILWVENQQLPCVLLHAKRKRERERKEDLWSMNVRRPGKVSSISSFCIIVGFGLHITVHKVHPVLFSVYVIPFCTI